MQSRKGTSIIIKVLRILGGIIASLFAIGCTTMFFVEGEKLIALLPIIVIVVTVLMLWAWSLPWKITLPFVGCLGVTMFIFALIVFPERNKIEQTERQERMEELNKFATLENVAHNIDGTVWSYTEVSQLGHSHWYKLVFRDGKLYFYSAFASEGEWGEPQVCERVTTKPHYYQYSIEEARYDDTGKKYICINFKSLGKYSFVPQTRTLYYEGIPLPYSLRPEDCNPWE